MQIPMSGPDLGEAEFSAVRDVLRSGSLSRGSQLQVFERAVAAQTGCKFAIGTSSGTSGLHLAIIAAGVHDHDFVITTPFSFIASSNVMLYERAIPLFVDVDPVTGNLDPALVAEAVDAFCVNRRYVKRWLPPALRAVAAPDPQSLKAILAVHAYGQPAAMEPLLETAHGNHLVIIEDACEALGSAYKGRQTGNWGDLAVFAFYPNKQITTGEGGMIVTNNAEWDALLRSLCNQGRAANDVWLEHVRLGYNYRLDEMSAALGAVQMQRLEELLAKRERVAQWYNTRLQANELVETPFIVPDTTRMSWFVYVVRLRPQVPRAAIIAALAECGIATRPYFVPIHLQPFYAERFGYERGSFPHAEALGDCCLALPFSSVMSEEQVDYVCRQLTSLTVAYAGRARRAV